MNHVSEVVGQHRIITESRSRKQVFTPTAASSALRSGSLKRAAHQTSLCLAKSSAIGPADQASRASDEDLAVFKHSETLQWSARVAASSLYS